MKVWGVVATLLLVFFLGTSGWLYSQNQKLQKDLSATENAKETAEKNLSLLKEKVGKKAELFVIFTHYYEDSSKVEKAKDLIKEINDPKLLSDWQAAEKTGTTEAGVQILKDLASSIAKDIGINAP